MQLLDLANRQLLSVSATPRLDAELLLAHTLQQTREYLHTWPEQPLTSIQTKQFNHLVQRRLQGEPIAYIIGECEFWSLALHVTPDVLIPRPETELLVELALGLYRKQDTIKIADLGTGSGAIALALAKEYPAWHVTALEQSHAALSIAQQNIARHQVSNVSLMQSDWFGVLTKQQFHIIVSNPPYVAKTDPHLNQIGVKFEPRAALVADDNGLRASQTIIQQAPNFLLDKGWLLLEHGCDQAGAVSGLLQQRGFTMIQTHNDLAKLPRVTMGVYTK